MDKWSIEGMGAGRAAKVVGVLILVAALSACGDDGGSQNPANNGADAGGDATLDDDASEDVGGGDAGVDAEPDVEEDTGPPDDDSDGVVNDEDNCPEVANLAQLDRDRDEVGDACDHFASIYDPSNPQNFEVTAEDEENISNDSFREGEAYELGLPFLIEGGVAAVEDGRADQDFFSFEITEPTLVLIEITATGDKLIPAGALLGYEMRDANVQRFVLGEQAGTSHYREMFLPVPGRYSLVVSDQRNLSTDPDVGGPDYGYTASISKVPMPEPEQVNLPAAPVEKEVDRAVHVYEVDATELDALTVASSAVPGANSIVLPMLAVYDPDENRTLSFTSPYQTNQQTAKVEYTTKLGERDRVWVIEDFWQRIGNNRTLVEFAEAQVDSEFETFSEQQDQRSSELVWLQPGTGVDAIIGPPRTVSETELAADTDYFLASVLPGSVVSFTVTPSESSLMQPDIYLGSLYEQQGTSSFYLSASGPSAENPGDPVTVTEFYGGLNSGEIAVRVRHDPNVGAEAPEGGPGFEYSISMEVAEPTIDELGELPAVVSGVFDTPGKTDFYRFTASAGDRLNFRIDASYFGQLTVYDADTYEPLMQTYSSRTLLDIEEDGEYIVHVAPYYEDRDPTMTYELGVQKVEPTVVGAAPVSETGVVDAAPFPKWYQMTLSAGTAYEATLEAPDEGFEEYIRIYDADSLDLIRSGSGPVRWLAPEATDVLIEVADLQNRGDAAYTYTLGVNELQSATLDLDTPTAGQLTDGTDRYIYSFTALPGAIEATVETTGGWEPQVTLARGQTLSEISQVTSHNGSLYYAESVEKDYALIVSAADETLAGPLDFEVNVTVHEPSGATAEAEPNDTPADAQALTQFPAAINGSFDGVGGDTTDVFTADLVSGQRIWAMSINRGDQGLYTVDPEFEIYAPDGTVVSSDGDSGEAWFPAIYGYEVSQDGIFEIRHQLEFGDDAGDYTLYVFTSPAPTP